MPKQWNEFSAGPQFVNKVGQRIDPILTGPTGLPNGKGKRTHLNLNDLHQLRDSLTKAVGQASASAANGPLPNRLRGRGRPPDNSVLIFINDIMRAIKAAGLQPGLRYEPPESLPVRIYKELAPLIWPGSAIAPRRVFERWQRHRDDLICS
jgi:hypothetical protein